VERYKKWKVYYICCIALTEVVRMLIEDLHLCLIILYKHFFFCFISESPYKIHITLSAQSANKKIPKWKQILLLKFMYISLLKFATDFYNITSSLPF
jgi:hypothetical protein